MSFSFFVVCSPFQSGFLYVFLTTIKLISAPFKYILLAVTGLSLFVLYNEQRKVVYLCIRKPVNDVSHFLVVLSLQPFSRLTSTKK